MARSAESAAAEKIRKARYNRNASIARQFARKPYPNASPPSTARSSGT